MNKKQCYQYGYENGYNIAESNRSDYNLANDDERERFIDEMIETECGIFRQYSPFEFFAHDINQCEEWRADSLWEAYEDGVYKGICKLAREEYNLIKNNHE